MGFLSCGRWGRRQKGCLGRTDIVQHWGCGAQTQKMEVASAPWRGPASQQGHSEERPSTVHPRQSCELVLGWARCPPPTEVSAQGSAGGSGASERTLSEQKQKAEAAPEGGEGATRGSDSSLARLRSWANRASSVHSLLLRTGTRGRHHPCPPTPPSLHETLHPFRLKPAMTAIWTKREGDQRATQPGREAQSRCHEAFVHKADTSSVSVFFSSVLCLMLLFAYLRRHILTESHFPCRGLS